MPNDIGFDSGPFSSNPFGASNGDFGGGRIRKPKFPAAAPAVAEQAKSSLVDKGLNGLQYVGSVLDKPGRAVRGVLDGNWREGLAAIPFSDSLGLTDAKQAVSPEDLLVHKGLMAPRDPYNDPGFFSKRTLASTAAGIALDPLSYLTFGGSALSKAGQAAKGLGATQGWGKQALIQGFTHLEPELQAAGHTAEEIAHMGRAGARIAPTGVVDAARAAGVDLQAGTPLAGHFGVGLPFGQPLATVGHGAVSQALAGAGDAVGDAIKYAPGVRTLRQWFDTNAARSNNPLAQRANEAAAVPLRQGLQQNNGVWEYGVRRKLNDLIQSDPGVNGTEMNALDLIRSEAEKLGTASDPAAWQADFARRRADGLLPGVADPDAVQRHILNNFDAYRGIGHEINQQGKSMIEQAQHYGADPHQLADLEAEYARRQYIAGNRTSPGNSFRPTQPFETGGTFDRSRQSAFKDVPGATPMINRFAMDPRISGPARTLDAANSHRVILDQFLNHYNDTGQFLSLDAATRARLAAKAAELEPVINQLDPLHAANQVPFYNPDAIADHVVRANAHARSVGGAAGATEGLASAARPITDYLPGGPLAGQAHVPLDQALGQVGLTTHRPYAPLTDVEKAHLNSLGLGEDAARAAIQAAPTDPAAAALVGSIDPAVVASLQRQGYTGGAARLYEQMARHGAPLQDLASGHYDPHEYLKNFAVSQPDVHALSEYMTGFSTPHEVGPFLKSLNSMQNLFKAFAYPLFPASHVRNGVSAAYNNFVHGTPTSAYQDAYNILRGQGIDHAGYDAVTGALAPADRAHALAGLAYGHAGIGTGGSFSEVSRNPTLASIDTLSGAPNALAPRLPLSGTNAKGNLLQDAAGLLSEAIPRTKAQANPFGIRGVFDQQRDTFAPLVAGRKVGENTEDFFRLANYLGNLQKGMAPDVAGRLTKAVHFDYGDLTPFESNYARKLVPFYTFMRKNLPAQAELLVNRPSAIAPTIRAMGAGENRQDYTPDYLASGPAVRLGSVAGPDGKDFTRFITGFGLPFEEALERLKFQSHDIGGHQVSLPDPVSTAQSYLGMLNPYMKAPLEIATNTQLHTGRKLSDLYKPTFWNGYGTIDGPAGDLLSEIGQNSPLTRFGSTFSKLTDDRKPAWAKALNLMTGVKISDVDLEKARNIEARKALEGVLQDDPRMAQFSNFYVKPGQVVDPELQKRMEAYTRFQQEAQAASQERKKQEELKKLRESGRINPGPF